nr:immunoglobulin light chain junction region [Macaca mulatta]MOX10240.1 immunoglobulin light chain junction region [Macaca mulatta]
CMRALEFPLTF